MYRIFKIFSCIFLFISYTVSLPYNVHSNGTYSIQSLPPGLKLRVMPLGDSITFGIGSTGSNSYRASLYKQLVAAGATVDFVGSQKSGNFAKPNHEGWSGYTINQISSMSERSLPKKPNVICLMGGTNDMAFGAMMGQDPTTAPTRLGALIDKLVAAVPDSVVLVATLTPLSNQKSSSAAEVYNGQIPAVVKARAEKGKKVAVVSMSALQKGDLSDGVHPNDAGYAKMADAWFKGFEDVAAKGWIKDPVAV